MVVACAALLVAVPAAIPAGAQAMTAAQLRVQLERAQAEADSAGERFRRASRASVEKTDTMVIRSGPITLLVIPAVLGDGERERIEGALAAARATLRGHFGDAGDRLFDTLPRVLRGRPGEFARFRPMMLRMNAKNDAFGMRIERPIQGEQITEALLRDAGRNLPLVAPMLAPLVGRSVSFASEAEEFEFAGRELALSASSPARRCRTGSLADCRRVLETDTSAARLERWFEPPDHRTVVALHRGAVAAQDTARQAALARCVAGADTACTRLLHVLKLREPVSGALRGTLVRHALETGAPGVLERLQEVPSGGLIAMLARAAELPEDSLVAGWHRRIDRAAQGTDVGSAPLILTAAAWSLVLVAFSAGRKPS